MSVIVCTRNSARTLERCLASIRQQSHPNLELIVVDNHSSDATATLAAQYCDVVATIGPERSAQRNHGASLSHGEILVFVDSDMVLEPDVVAEAVGLLEDPSVPAVVVPEISFGVGFWTNCRILERQCYVGDELVEAARVYRRECFGAVGGYDEELNAAEDWDLSRRVAGHLRLPRTGAVIRHDEGQTTLRGAYRKRRYYGPGYLRYLRKHGRSALGQGNPVLRPAFLRNWRTLAKHPVLTGGMLSLKTVEFVAILQVAIERSAHDPTSGRARQVYR